MIQLPNLDCKFILGLLTLHPHHMPLGMGRVKIWVLEILTLLPSGASVFHKHMSCLPSDLDLEVWNTFKKLEHGTGCKIWSLPPIYGDLTCMCMQTKLQARFPYIYVSSCILGCWLSRETQWWRTLVMCMMCPYLEEGWDCSHTIRQV